MNCPFCGTTARRCARIRFKTGKTCCRHCLPGRAARPSKLFYLPQGATKYVELGEVKNVRITPVERLYPPGWAGQREELRTYDGTR